MSGTSFTPPADHPLIKTYLAGKKRGVITDVDGTISQFAANPEIAYVTPRSLETLAGLQQCLPLVAVITGRAAGDVRQRVNVPGLVYVGNHGMERWHNGTAHITPEVLAYRPAIEAVRDAIAARQVPGMLIEDKIATLSIHYRQAHDPAAVAREFRPLVEDLSAAHGLNTFSGRLIFEVRPPVDIHKGSALRALIEEFHLDAAIFLGDDVTDADAMRVARQMRDAGVCHAVSIGVHADHTPPSVHESADIMVDGVQGVEDFLAWLLSAVSASSS